MTKDEIRNILEAPITNPDFIDKFVLAGEKLVNFFELGAGLILLSDSTMMQKSELLITLFDTNENYIIGDNELVILVRCCLTAIATLASGKYYNLIKTEDVKRELKEIKKDNRYAKDEGISVSDFTHFLMESTEILKFLNYFGLFM
jgi:hypothetical protein